MLQVAQWLTMASFPNNRHNQIKVGYISGEESENQIKIRADRLHVKSPNLYILSENRLEVILHHLSLSSGDSANSAGESDGNNNSSTSVSFDAVVIDSIQAIRSEDSKSASGSVNQVKFCAAALTQLAKAKNIPLFLVGHITKSGEIAGPTVLEHMVDCVLYLDGEGDNNQR